MKYLRTPVSLIVICIVTSSIWYALLALLPASGALGLGDEMDFSAIALWIGLPVAVGVFLGKLFFTLARMSTERVNLLDILADLPLRRDVWLAVLASPLIVLGLAMAFQENIASAQTLVMAFENGFFVEAAVVTIMGGNRPELRG